MVMQNDKGINLKSVFDCTLINYVWEKDFNFCYNNLI